MVFKSSIKIPLGKIFISGANRKLYAHKEKGINLWHVADKSGDRRLYWECIGDEVGLPKG